MTPQDHQPPIRSEFHRKMVEEVVPFLTSLVLHVGLLVLAFAAYHAVKIAVEGRSKPQIQVTVPTGDLFGGDNAGLPDSKNRSELPAMQNKIPTDSKSGSAVDNAGKASKNPRLYVAGGESSVIGVSNTGGPAGTGRSQSGTLYGNADGTDSTDTLARLGPPHAGPRDIFGDPNHDKPGGDGPPPSVIYVIDASGSMSSHFDDVRIQLNKSIKNLRFTQAFNVIFFQEQKFTALNPAGMISRTDINREHVAKQMEAVVSTGSTDPLGALKLAFSLHPGVIYLLTDGDFPDNDAVLALIRENQRTNKVVINTIAFIGQDGPYQEFLKSIANETGGTFRVVTEADLRP